MNTDDLNEVRAGLQELAGNIKGSLPPGFGFVLLVSSSQPGAALLYVSTLDRGDVLQLMREFIATNREERVWRREMPEVELSEEFEQWWVGQLKRYPGLEQMSAQYKEWCQDAFTAGRASA